MTDPVQPDAARAARVAIVTGAGAGIGAAVARRLAADGAAVAAWDADAEAAEDTATEIRRTGGTARAYAVDVADGAGVRTASDAVVADLGGVDVLANVAGVVRYGTVVEMSEEDWDLMVDTNLKGIFLTAKYVVPHLQRRGGGVIVNTASAQAFASQPRVAAYTATKGAIVAMTRALAVDHAADGIRAVCVCPGSVHTPMLRYGAEMISPDADPDETMRSWGSQHPLGVLIEPEDVANLVAFLTSAQAGAITGAPYLIDAGLTSRLGV